MTHANYQLPPTEIMAWYAAQPKKTDVIRYVAHRLNHKVSNTLISNWFLGYSIPKMPEYVSILSEISGIGCEKLFELTEDEKH